MAYNLVAHTEVTGANTTPAIDTTGANLIVLVYASGDSITPTDNKSNTYTLCNQNGIGSDIVNIYYCFEPTVGSGHTFSQNLSWGAFFVAAFSGAVTSPVDVDTENTTAGATSLAPGSGTPSENNELVVVGICIGSDNSSHAIDGGFTLLDQIDGVDGVNYGGGLAYLIQTTAAAANPSYSWTPSNSAAIAMNSFKDTSAAGTAVKDLIQSGLIVFPR